MSAAAEASLAASARDSDTFAEATGAAAGTEAVEPGARTSRSARLLVAVGILTVIALVAALYLARAFFVPLLIGILASYALSPLVDWLKSNRVPGPLAAAVVLAVLVGGLSWVAVTLNDEAVAMIEKLPDAAHKLRLSLSVARAGGPTALQKLQEAATEIQGAATDASTKAGTHVTAAKPAEPSLWLRDYALAQSALLIAVAAQTPIVLLLTYFLLASGSHFRRKLVQLVGPSLSRKKDAVGILEEIDVQIQRYLLAMLLSNTLLGVCSWLVFAALGLEQAGVWGAAAGVLHFIPYLGPLLVALGTGLAAFLQFGSLFDALLIAG